MEASFRTAFEVHSHPVSFRTTLQFTLAQGGRGLAGTPDRPRLAAQQPQDLSFAAEKSRFAQDCSGGWLGSCGLRRGEQGCTGARDEVGELHEKKGRNAAPGVQTEVKLAVSPLRVAAPSAPSNGRSPRTWSRTATAGLCAVAGGRCRPHSSSVHPLALQAP